MAALLLIVISCVYIGLGVPDSLLGASWSAMRADLGLPLSYANFVSVIVGIGTITMSFLNSRLIKKFGTKSIVIISTALTALALLGYSFSDDLFMICLFAVPMGMGAGAIDATLNNFVAMHYSAKHMSFLHCFYGIGVSVSPYLMSFALKNDDWRMGFRYAFFLQIVITAIAVLSYPLWDRVNGEEAAGEKDYEVIPIPKLIRMKGVMTVGGAFFASCAIEALCNIWGASYLSEAEGFSASKASALIVLYYIGLASGRFVSGLLSKKLSSLRIMLLGEGFTAVATVIILLPLPPIVKAASLFFVGFGNGPAFPNLTHIIPKLFGVRLSGAVIGFEMGFAYISILTVPIVFGQLAQRISIKLFGVALLIAYLIMIVNMLKIRRLENNATSSETGGKNEKISNRNTCAR